MPGTAIDTSPHRGRSLAREMSQWLDRVLDPDYHRFAPGEVWHPAVNVYEDAEQYTVVADLAGVRVEGIELLVENGVLVLTGSREAPGLAAGGSTVPLPAGGEASGRSGPRPRRVHLMEIDHGRFRRAIELPGDVDVGGIEASYRCGYLWVRLPRTDRSKGETHA